MNNERYPDNAPGTWFVDEACIECALCEELAPSVFRPSADGDHHVVYHQPGDAEELAQAAEAQENCPVEAIQNGGP